MFERALAQSTKSVLEGLSRCQAVGDFYLGGGSGLALQLGHRVSRDLDLFSTSDFEGDKLARALSLTGPVEVIESKRGTLVATVGGIEVGFYYYPYRLLFATETYRDMAVASWKDILCMKLVAVGQRAAKRDYVDVYFGLRAGLTLAELLGLIKRKYAEVAYSEYHLVRSLVYFDEVENEPMPELLVEATWEEIKACLVENVRNLGVI